MPRGRRKTSGVWNYFTSPSDRDAEQRRFVTCIVCNEKFSYCSSTGNLSSHLRSRHSTVWPLPESPTTSSSGTSAPPLQSVKKTIEHYCKVPFNQKRADKITGLIANVIVGDLRPISLVDGPHFQELISYIEPNYTMPSRQTFTRMLEDKYTLVKDQLTQELAGIASMALTTDIWTSCRMESFLGITAHYIREQGQMVTLERRVLAVRQVTASNTADNIVRWLELVLSEYEIVPSQISAVVTDNGANVVAAMRQCTASHGWQHVRCTAHTLQLCVNDCVKVEPIKRALAAARHLVQHIKQSSRALNDLRQVYDDTRPSDSPATFNLIMDCPTRWDSTYDMIERLCTHQWAIRQYLSTLRRDRAATLELRDSHWLIIQKLVELLAPIKTSTKFLQGEKYFSLSSIYPIVKSLCLKYEETDDADEAFERNFKINMMSSLRERFSDVLNFSATPNIFYKATYLDPNYKDKYFSHRDKSLVREIVLEEMAEIPRQGSRHTERSALPTATSPSNLDVILAYGQSRESDGSSNSSIEDERQNVEIVWYQRQKASEDSVAWWIANRVTAPMLYKQAQKYLVIPATSAPAERCFSSAGLTSSGLRSRLTGPHVEQLTFLHCNKALLD